MLATGPAAAKRGAHRARRGDPGRVPTTSATESTPEVHENTAEGEEGKVLLDHKSFHLSNLPGNWQEVKPPAETPVKEKVSRSRDRETDYVRKERRNELRNSR